MKPEDLLPLIAAWKFELAKLAYICRQNVTSTSEAAGLGNKKADFLEGFYSVLTCLECAIASPQPNPLDQ